MNFSRGRPAKKYFNNLNNFIKMKILLFLNLVWTFVLGLTSQDISNELLQISSYTPIDIIEINSKRRDYLRKRKVQNEGTKKLKHWIRLRKYQSTKLKQTRRRHIPRAN